MAGPTISQSTPTAPDTDRHAGQPRDRGATAGGGVRPARLRQLLGRHLHGQRRPRAGGRLRPQRRHLLRQGQSAQSHRPRSHEGLLPGG